MNKQENKFDEIIKGVFTMNDVESFKDTPDYLKLNLTKELIENMRSVTTPYGISGGLNFPIEILEAMYFVIPSLPIETVALFANNSLVSDINSDENDYKIVRYLSVVKERTFDSYNASICGDLAYIYLNSKEDMCKEDSYKMFKGFKDWFAKNVNMEEVAEALIKANDEKRKGEIEN